MVLGPFAETKGPRRAGPKPRKNLSPSVIPASLSPTLVPDLIGDPVKEWIQCTYESRVVLFAFVCHPRPRSGIQCLSSSRMTKEKTLDPLLDWIPRSEPVLDVCNRGSGTSVEDDRRGKAGIQGLRVFIFPVVCPSPTPIGDPVSLSSRMKQSKKPWILVD